MDYGRVLSRTADRYFYIDIMEVVVVVSERYKRFEIGSGRSLSCLAREHSFHFITLGNSSQYQLLLCTTFYYGRAAVFHMRVRIYILGIVYSQSLKNGTRI